MAVGINLRKPLVSKIVINGCTQLIEFESLPNIFFHHGIYGHLKETCPNLNPSAQSDIDSMQHDAIPPSTYTETNLPADPFGPWMVVGRRKHISRSVNAVKHAAVHSLISKRTSIFGSKITKSSHEPHVAPMKRGHEHSRLANSFSSKGQNSTAACLDRSKHQSVRHMLDSHPPIPAIVLTGSKTHHGAKSMAE
ncbi:hypothetical protein V6N12_076310 [Hibiscus sabdariffa]|uniref:Uncharacterized protein n=1 Tax=Hibiscus sabdariffa TaxID=183260 RepID=A0ABR2D9G0_9ROSI